MTPSQGVSRTTAVEKHASKTGFGRALEILRLFTMPGVHPFDEVAWETRNVVIGSGEKKHFEYNDVEFPAFWSQNAANITASKYFRGEIGSKERERSVKQMVTRVASNIRKWGEELGHLASKEQGDIFEAELTHILLHQKAAFNSPVWFNVGMYDKPQCSACFILNVEDNMESILEWISDEGMIFKRGSGAGVNVSKLRSSRETLSNGGVSSGPVAFMRGADSVAGMIKSGGATRRAAKMVIMNVDHPDIMEFIRTKVEEEDKVRAFMAAGYNMQDLNNPAWNSIQYQNANNSVRVTDEFMRAVKDKGTWHTRFVTKRKGEVADEYDAHDLMMEIAKAAWECADPGIQYDTTINAWHTAPHSGRINASNPCSEYMHLDNSACNLASINLMKYMREDGSFMVNEFKHTVDVMILAQEIVVDASGYPTPKIAENAHKFRELGLGYANLGAFLMAKGLSYDSDEGRALAGAITALMCAEAYRYSAFMARRVGPFEGYELNKEPMLGVIEKHKNAFERVEHVHVGDEPLVHAAREAWAGALEEGRKHGFRNSQATVLAPTGTIALMMDCDTTGIEPPFALVTHKQLVGGGWMKFVNGTVPLALKHLGYVSDEIEEMVKYVEEHSSMEGAPHLKAEHLNVFDCAVRSAKGTRSISWQGHVKMVAAAQPFISGAISKTFNMPSDATIQDVFDAYMMGWHLGLKAFAVYRDGCKAAQPLQTASHSKKHQKQQLAIDVGPARRRLPPTRVSKTHKFDIAGHEGYLTYSLYPDGKLAEIFIRMSKQGSTLAGLLDVFAISVSMALQYGVPLKDLAHKFIYSRFEPSGYTANPHIQIATSIADYLFRFLALEFLTDEELAEFAMTRAQSEESADDPFKPFVVAKQAAAHNTLSDTKQISLDGKNGTTMTFAGTVCKQCGGMMIRTGSCMTCIRCGNSNGGCS